MTTVPLLHEDGTIRTADGYDEATQLFCHDIPDIAVPDRPTLDDDVKPAFKKLRYAIRTLPFADAEKVKEAATVNGAKIFIDIVDLDKNPGRDESAYLVMLLTAIIRRAFQCAPALALITPKTTGSGTGKGLAIKAIAIIASGRPVRRPVAIGKGSETEKAIVVALALPDGIISLDNINYTVLHSQALCMALTEEGSAARELGFPKLSQFAHRPFIAVNGNGLVIGEDLARRIISSEFNARSDAPELRKFPSDLVADVTTARGELLRAVLTIWRYGRQNPAKLKRGLPLGSFEQWCDWARDPMHTLGCADPVARIAVTKANDPGRQHLEAIFDAWDAAFGSNEVTCDDILKGSGKTAQDDNQAQLDIPKPQRR